MDSVNAELQEDGCYVALTPEPLSVQDIMNRVRRPDAGAIVMFAGEGSGPTAVSGAPLTLEHRHHQGQLWREARQRTALLGLPGVGTPQHDGDCKGPVCQTLPQSHCHGPPAGRGAHRRGEHPDRRFYRPSAGCVASRGGGTRGLQSPRRDMEARGVRRRRGGLASQPGRCHGAKGAGIRNRNTHPALRPRHSTPSTRGAWPWTCRPPTAAATIARRRAARAVVMPPRVVGLWHDGRCEWVASQRAGLPCHQHAMPLGPLERAGVTSCVRPTGQPSVVRPHYQRARGW